MLLCNLVKFSLRVAVRGSDRLVARLKGGGPDAIIIILKRKDQATIVELDLVGCENAEIPLPTVVVMLHHGSFEKLRTTKTAFDARTWHVARKVIQV